MQNSYAISSGGRIEVRESILRGSGPPGPPGERGPTGRGIHILGEVANKAALMALPTGNLIEGDSYLVTDTGHMWSWFERTEDTPYQWNDTGRMRGRTGYLTSVMSRFALAGSTGGQQTLRPNVPVEVRMDVTHNDIEPLDLGSGTSTKPMVLGLRIDAGGNIAIDSLNMNYFLYDWPVNFRNANEMADNPASLNGSGTYMISTRCMISPVTVTRGWVKLELIRRDIATNAQVVEATSQVDIDDLDETVYMTALVRHTPNQSWGFKVTTTMDAQIIGMECETARMGGTYGATGQKGDTGPPRQVIGPYTYESTLLATVPTAEVYAYAEDTGRAFAWQVKTGGQFGWYLVGTTKGTKGDSGTGYASYNAVANGDLDTENPPPGNYRKVTTDQKFPYPNGDVLPHTPFAIKDLAQKVEKFVIARFPTYAAYLSKRPSRGLGEVSFTDDKQQLHVEVRNVGAMRIAYAHVGNKNTHAVPVDGAASPYPEGTISMFGSW